LISSVFSKTKEDEKVEIKEHEIIVPVITEASEKN